MLRQSGNKYGAKKSNYNGYIYDSGLEASYAAELDIRVKAGEIESFERQHSVDLIVNGYHIGTYKLDFLLFHHDGTKEYVEVKGFPTPDWKWKWKIFKAMYADRPKTIITLVGKGYNPRMRKVRD